MALQTQQGNRNTRQNNLRFLHETATWVVRMHAKWSKSGEMYQQYYTTCLGEIFPWWNFPITVHIILTFLFMDPCRSPWFCVSDRPGDGQPKVDTNNTKTPQRKMQTSQKTPAYERRKWTLMLLLHANFNTINYAVFHSLCQSWSPVDLFTT